MKIDSSYVGMESARTYRSSSTRKLSVSIQQGWISKESLQNGNQMIGSGGMEDAFENDMTKSTQITRNAYHQRSLIIRGKEQFSRLLSPLL